MSARSIARSLSNIQRSSLVEHAPGPQRYFTDTDRKTKQSLVDAGLLRPTARENQAKFPPELVLSELGREVVCFILGDYADALVASGVLEQLPIILTENKLADAMKAAQRRAPCPTQSIYDVAVATAVASAKLTRETV